MINKNLYCFFYGKVQGIGYKKWIKMKPFKYSLRGWFKNCKDRQIEFEVYQSEVVIHEFIKIFNKEPFFFEVEKLNLFKKNEISQEFLVLLS